jgi:hypothetical protein
MQPMFKLPMDPKTTARSPMSSSMMSHMQLSNMMDKNQKSPLMRPDSHGESCHPISSLFRVISCTKISLKKNLNSSQFACLLISVEFRLFFRD